MGNEDLRTIPEKESDEFIKSSVEDLVLIPRESEDTSDSDKECDLPFCDNSVTFSNPLFDAMMILPLVMRDHDPSSLKDEPDNDDLKSMVKIFDPGIHEKIILQHRTKYWKEMTHDIPGRVSEMIHIPNYHLNDRNLQGYILYEIHIILNNCGKSLQHFGLPPPPQGLLDMLAKLLIEERNYNQQELMQERDESVSKLNGEQRKMHDPIINANATNQQELIFIYGHGGTGNTVLWKTIISTLHSEGKIVLAVASSGIASLLLSSGRTTHFSTDRSLKDILTVSHSLFGGKSVLLGRDFQQTLPVKKGASKMEVITSCISESQLWPHFRFFTLKENMRLSRPNISADERNLINSFASWLLDISDEKTSQPDQQDPENTSWIDISLNY
ncbi:DNA helicase [Tanacetum coccineum]|uniref:ATP-dependent DNA helicase n=1 Tax=Tanacetum coccineum TaxID=301880 RepID=A0ABQ4X786_9ASTR